MQAEEVIVVMLCALGILAGVAVIWMAMQSRRQIREMEHRERLAMIERGLVPAPESDPAGIRPEVRRGPSAGIAERQPGTKRRGDHDLAGIGVHVLAVVRGWCAWRRVRRRRRIRAGRRRLFRQFAPDEPSGGTASAGRATPREMLNSEWLNAEWLKVQYIQQSLLHTVGRIRRVSLSSTARFFGVFGRHAWHAGCSYLGCRDAEKHLTAALAFQPGQPPHHNFPPYGAGRVINDLPALPCTGVQGSGLRLTLVASARREPSRPGGAAAARRRPSPRRRRAG